MHPIVTNINKKGGNKTNKKRVQVFEDGTNLLYKRIIRDMREKDKLISSRNSFSYENISIKFSMYQVHTKSINMGRISNRVEYKKREKKVILQSFMTFRIEALQYF